MVRWYGGGGRCVGMRGLYNVQIQMWRVSVSRVASCYNSCHWVASWIKMQNRSFDFDNKKCSHEHCILIASRSLSFCNASISLSRARERERKRDYTVEINKVSCKEVTVTVTFWELDYIYININLKFKDSFQIWILYVSRTCYLHHAVTQLLHHARAFIESHLEFHVRKIAAAAPGQ